MKMVKGLFFAFPVVCGMFLSAGAFAQVLNEATAADAAASLATLGVEQGGLGCSKVAITTVDTVDVFRGEPSSLFRVVLYADCIPCLHVYMFDKQSGKKVFSRSVVLQDPVSYQQTCVIDRERYL